MKKLTALIFALLFASCVHAQLYEIRMEGWVNEVRGTIWDSSIALGIPMHATYQFDQSVGAIGEDAVGATYHFSSNPAVTSVGNYRVEGAQTSLRITDNDPIFGEGYQIDTWSPPTGLPVDGWGSMGARLWSRNFNLLSDTEQPVRSFDISEFGLPYIFLFAQDSIPGQPPGMSGYIAAKMTSYEIVRFAPVPEASSFAGAAAVLCVIGIWFRVRQRRI